jgi:predicted nucleotidyltransferase
MFIFVIDFMESTITSEMVEKISVIKNKYTSESVYIMGAKEAPGETDEIDIFYSITPDIWEKYPDASFFNLFKRIQDDLETSLGRPVDLVDSASLEPIGQGRLLQEMITF